MTEYLIFSIGKFTFKTATDRYYSGEGMWAKFENDLVRLGISDFLQQRSGDVAFVELKSMGSEVAFGDEIAVVETIKVDISLSSPVSGEVVELNASMKNAPEVINQDPYGAGWLVTLKPANWETDFGHLLEPQIYYNKIKREVELETDKS